LKKKEGRRKERVDEKAEDGREDEVKDEGER